MEVKQTVFLAVTEKCIFGLFSRTVRKPLDLDLKFHPYKMIVFQKLCSRDLQNRHAGCQKR